jgi:hypothetical protein
MRRDARRCVGDGDHSIRPSSPTGGGWSAYHPVDGRPVFRMSQNRGDNVRKPRLTEQSATVRLPTAAKRLR